MQPACVEGVWCGSSRNFGAHAYPVSRMRAQELNQAGAGGDLGAHPLPIDGESAEIRLDLHGGDLLQFWLAWTSTARARDCTTEQLNK